VLSSDRFISSIDLSRLLIEIELECPPVACGAGQFLCATDRRCINESRRCDGIAGNKENNDVLLRDEHDLSQIVHRWRTNKTVLERVHRFAVRITFDVDPPVYRT
jgi:hypothetical protein